MTEALVEIPVLAPRSLPLTAPGFSLTDYSWGLGEVPLPRFEPGWHAGFYVRSGRVEVEAQGRSVVASQGDFVLAPDGLGRNLRALSVTGHVVAFAVVARAGGPALAGPLRRRVELGASQWYLGHLFTFLATGAETAGAFTLIEAEALRGGEPPRHTHEREDELYYLLAGAIRFEVGGASIVARAGDVVFLPRGVPHSFEILTPTVRTLIFLAPAGLEGYFFEFSEPAEELAPRPLLAPPPVERLVAVGADYGIAWHLPS